MSENISYRINYSELRNSVYSQGYKILKKNCENLVLNKVINAQKIMISAFENHPVTIEIKSGSQDSMTANVSGTLSGYGNLFSFIGFNEGEDPTEGLERLLRKEIKVVFLGMLLRGKSQADVRFEIRMPNIFELEEVTPLPWSPGDSWASAIERGLSNLGEYYSIKGKGRSEGGIQLSENRKKTGGRKGGPSSSSPIDYISFLLETFKNALYSA